MTSERKYAIMQEQAMYQIEFYTTPNGKSYIKSFLDQLLSESNTNKDARIQYKQAVRYIELLSIHGTDLPIEVCKHIRGSIWELRPGKNRIFFFGCLNDTFVLLHHYRKKTNRTPSREIERAETEAANYIKQKE